MNYIFFSILGALFLSLSDILSKYVLNNEISYVNYIFWSHGITYLLCTVILLFIAYKFKFLLSNSTNLKNIVKLHRKNNVNLCIFLSGILGFLALITIIYSFSISKNIGYNVSIISCTCLITLLLSIIFFKAKIESKGIAGCVLIFIGVLLISQCNVSLHK